MSGEYLEIVDERGAIIGIAPRSACHGDPSLIHRTAHVLVFNSRGELFLQRRSWSKDIQPGKWDTSVGGHLDVGETYKQAARREMAEELGIRGVHLVFLYAYQMRNEVESENVQTFRCMWDGSICFDQQEIKEGRFWTVEEIEEALETGTFTPNFEEEFERYRQVASDDRMKAE